MSDEKHGRHRFIRLFALEPKSDVNETQADESNGDGESDNEINAANSSMNTETTTSSFNRGERFFSFVLIVLKLMGFLGSSGLLLLAAAAEKKRRDEEGQ